MASRAGSRSVTLIRCQPTVKPRLGIVTKAATQFDRIVAKERRRQTGQPRVVVNGRGQRLEGFGLQSRVAKDWGRFVGHYSPIRVRLSMNDDPMTCVPATRSTMPNSGNRIVSIAS